MKLINKLKKSVGKALGVKQKKSSAIKPSHKKKQAKAAVKKIKKENKNTMKAKQKPQPSKPKQTRKANQKEKRQMQKKDHKSVPHKNAANKTKKKNTHKGPIKQSKPLKGLAKTPSKKPAKTPALKKTAKVTVQKPKDRDIEFAQHLHLQPIIEKKVPKYPILPGADNERIKTVVSLLKEMAKKGQIQNWIINFAYIKGCSTYMRGFETEDDISSIREDMIVTIYEEFQDKTIGDARIPIISSDAAEIKQQLSDAKVICESSRKPFFELPEPVDGIEQVQSYDEKMLNDLFNGENKTAKALAQQIKSSMQQSPDIKLNSCELHANAGTIRVINSKGIDFSFHKTTILLEAVLSCRIDKIEREYYFSKTTVSPEQLDILDIFQQKAKIARDATRAQQNPGFVGDVVLSGNAVMEFFSPHHDINPIVLHTSAKLAYMGLSSFELDKPIGQLLGGEPVTISTYPQLPMGLASMPIDEEGTPLSTVDLIRNGVFVRHIATQCYAQYIGVPATGNLTNIYVHPGATREEHLRGNNYFEIVSFSWFSPNQLSGDFSAEIRLAYLWVNGKKIAIRGGTFTGNVFKNMMSARFSKEITQVGTYYGPRTILFKNATITKFE